MNSGRSGISCLLSVAHLRKQIGPIVCVQDVSLEVFAREVVAVVGGNGSGKTTACDLLSGCVAPDSGTITFVGERVENSGRAWFGRHGVLRTFQTPRTFEQMTIWNILLLAATVQCPPSFADVFFRKSRRKTHASTEAEEMAQAMLDRFGWRDYRDRQARALSYGQCKLLAAMTLRMARGVLAICDEPTAGLDGTRSAEVFDLLFEWKAEDARRGMIVMTHDLEYVGLRADRMLRIDRGVLTGE